VGDGSEEGRDASGEVGEGDEDVERGSEDAGLEARGSREDQRSSDAYRVDASVGTL
jgi:hypothetical protein